MVEAIIERLREMADIQLDIEFCSLLLDAADMLKQLSDTVDQMEKNRIVVQVKLTDEQMREAFSKALSNCIGKDLDYVFEAIKEKMTREGELNETENT